jgi:hypothetical protein
MDAAGQANLADAVVRLARRVDQLNRDVKRLCERIEPGTGELRDIPFAPPPMRTMKHAFETITDARKTLMSIEYHLNAIRGVMDAIQNDAHSREELKQWIKNR